HGLYLRVHWVERIAFTRATLARRAARRARESPAAPRASTNAAIPSPNGVQRALALQPRANGRMIGPTMGLSRERRFRLGNAAAWLPQYAVYYFAFLIDGRSERTALAALCNLLPDALLGVVVVLVARRAWRALERRARIAALVGGGLVFVAVSTWGKATLAM